MFLTDVVETGEPIGDGEIDTLFYYLGPVNELWKTPNPNDRKLYRKLNSQPAVSANLGITHFELKYYDALGDTLEIPVQKNVAIQHILVDIRIENSYAYNEEYSTLFWRQLWLMPRNLSMR